MIPCRLPIAALALAACAALAGCCDKAPDQLPPDAAALAPLHDPRPTAPPAGGRALLALVDETPQGDPEIDPDAETEQQMWQTIEEVFGRKGEVKEGVYRLVTPRDDLFVTMDGMDVPSGAFLESDFRFWRCPCGKLLVNGQFVLADYEVNDVVDELHEGRLHVVAIAPLLLHEHPRLLMVRFQAEGRSRAIAEALKSTLSYTGEERNAPIDLAPEAE